MKKYRSVLLVFIVAALITTLVPVSFASAKTKTKKCTMYKLIKKGKYVYCQNGLHIFKVNLKTKKVKKLGALYGANMKLKGKYLYAYNNSQGLFGANLYRYNVKTGKKKLLAKDVDQMNTLAISGKKIYYRKIVKKGTYDFTYKKRVMKLNGKAKKSTKIKGETKVKSANVSGYHVWDTFDRDTYDWDDYSNNSPEGKINYYLSTPKGDILLERNFPAVD